MKTKFTFLVVLILLTTIIYALDPTQNKSSKLKDRFLKNRQLMVQNNTENKLSRRKTEFQKQANSLKSGQAIKQRLDSLTYKELEEDGFEKGKSEFIYDVNGMLTNEREYYWDEATAKMVLISISESTYDATNNRIQYVNTYRDETTNQFVTEYKVIYSYDNNGNKILGITYQPNNNHELIQESKTDYTYDSNGKLVQEISSSFDENTNQFNFSYKTEYKYSNNGKEAEQIYFTWNGFTSKQWEARSKTESSYDSQGNLILLLESSPINFNNVLTWTPDNKYEYTYDQNGLLTQTLEYVMDNNNQWKLDDKGILVYDDFGNNIQSFYYYNWDSQTNQWGNIYKDEFTYDNKYTKNDLILPDYEDIVLFTHMITEMKEFYLDINTNEWVLEYQVSLAYSPVNVTSVTQDFNGLASVYPNPFSETVSFSFPVLDYPISIELFDLQGRKIMSKVIGNNEKINMESLNNGIYIYNLNMDGKVQSGKLVKQK